MGSFSFLFRWRNAVWKRLNSRAMAWRVLVGGPWDVGMKTRTWGLLLKIF
jgi:hypothetical protein